MIPRIFGLVCCLFTSIAAVASDSKTPEGNGPIPVTGWLSGNRGSMYLSRLESYALEEVETARWEETEYERGRRQVSIQVRFVAFVMPRGCNTAFAERAIVGHFSGDTFSKPLRLVIQFSDLKRSHEIGTLSLCPGVQPLRISFSLPLASKTIVDGGQERVFVQHERMLLEFPGDKELPLKLEINYSNTDGTLAVREVQ